MADYVRKSPLSHKEKRRNRQREPVVFVEPSASTRKKSAVASSNLRSKKGGQTQSEPVVFVSSAFSKECPQVKVTFGCPREVDELDEQLKNKELTRAVKSILRSLTPETFQASVTQLMKLRVNTEEKLQEVVNLIFESAITGPHSAKLYARLCSSLPKIQFQCTADSTTSVSFSILLARRCNAEYRSIFGKENTVEKSERGLKQMKNELDDATPSRSIGTIKFIGELFLAHILSKDVMHSCIKSLLKNQDAESLECLCELLQIIGTNLEIVTAKQVMDSYYHQMHVIAKNDKTPSRICQMLKTAADPFKRRCLRVNGGRVPKAEDEASMSTRQEKEKINMLPEPCNWPITFGSVIFSNGQFQFEPTVDEKPLLNLDKYGQVEEQIQCQNHASQLSLSPVDEEPQLNLERSEESRQPELNNDQTGLTSTPPVKPIITEKDIESFSEMIITNYLTNGNIEEALNCVAEQISPSVLHVFVCSAVDMTFESSIDSRRKMGLLLLQLHETGVLPAEQIVKGLQDTVETAVDIAEAVPNIWRCLAEVINPVPHEGTSPLMKCLEKSSFSHLLDRLVC